MDMLEKIKMLEAEADEKVGEEYIDPDDLYFVKHIPSGKVLKKSFIKTMQNDFTLSSNRLKKLELINHWNRTASSHQPVTYLYWL